MDQFEQFYADHAVDGVLSDEDAARMLLLPAEGDTGPKPEDSEPAAVVPPAPAAEEVVVPPPVADAPAEPVPVLLAKDGVHTIEYQKLVDAREEAKKWEKAATDAAAELEALRKAPAATAPAPSPAAAPAVAGEDVFGDYSEEALKAGVEKLVADRMAAYKADIDAKVEQALAPVQAKAQTDAATAHFTTIYTAHPDVESVVESAEMKAFIAKQPSFTRGQYTDVLANGSATQVVELLDLFKASKPQPAAAAPSPAATAAAKAAEIVAKVKPAAPTSLSDIPAGSAAHHDEIEAMREMSQAALQQKFAGKSSEQILELLTRVI